MKFWSEIIEQAKSESVRLFFALWPDAESAAQLDHAGKKLQKLCGGKRTRAETIHLTLVFLGETELARLDELRQLAAGIQARAFTLKLGQLGFWPHNRIAWAGTDAVPAELGMLVEQLRAGLRGSGFRFDSKPFVPHITLLRKADCRSHALPSGEVAWRASEFVLVRSVPAESGSAYEVVGRWKLS